MKIIGFKSNTATVAYNHKSSENKFSRVFSGIDNVMFPSRGDLTAKDLIYGLDTYQSRQNKVSVMGNMVKKVGKKAKKIIKA